MIINGIHCFISGCCHHHDGFLINTEVTNLEICTPSEVLSLLREYESKRKKYSNRHEEFEQQTGKFQWICCDEPFRGVYSGGCKRGKHGFFSDATNQLTQEMIEKWEDACRYNEEYREKRTILLKQQ